MKKHRREQWKEKQEKKEARPDRRVTLYVRLP